MIADEAGLNGRARAESGGAWRIAFAAGHGPGERTLKMRPEDRPTGPTMHNLPAPLDGPKGTLTLFGIDQTAPEDVQSGNNEPSSAKPIWPPPMPGH